jgi:hypothetical protein
MAQPSRNSVGALNPALTDVSIAVVQSEMNFGAGRMILDVPVAKQSAKYQVYTPGFFHRSDAQKIAPGGRYPRSGFELSDDLYSADVIGIEFPIPDQTRQNQPETIDLDRDAAVWGTMQMLIRREKDFLGNFFKSGVWTGGTGTSPSTKWNASGSNPLVDMRKEITSVHAKTGIRPNVAGMSRLVWDVLVDHPSLIGRLSNDVNKFIQRAFVAALLELDEIVVFDAIENTAAEGAADVNAFIASTDDVLFMYRPKAASQFTPASAYRFTWSAFEGAGPASNRIVTYRDEPVASDIVRTEMAYDQKLVAPDLGAYLTDVLS